MTRLRSAYFKACFAERTCAQSCRYLAEMEAFCHTCWPIRDVWHNADRRAVPTFIIEIVPPPALNLRFEKGEYSWGTQDNIGLGFSGPADERQQPRWGSRLSLIHI